MDEVAHDGPAVERDTEEAGAQAGGLLSQEVLDPTHTREPGDDRHGWGRGGPVGREEPHPETTTTQEATETPKVGGQSGREFLLLLAHAHIGLRALQPVDVDRPSESAGAAGPRAGRVDNLRRLHRPHFPPGRCRAVPDGLPRAGSHGLQQQEARRSLLQVRVVHPGPPRPNAPGPAPAELR